MELIVPVLLAGCLFAPVLVVSARDLPRPSRNFIVRIMLGAFAVRVALATLFAAVPSLRIFHEDATSYEWLAMQIARAWSGEHIFYQAWIAPGSHNTGVVYVFASILYVLGKFPLNISIVNSFLGTLSVLVVFRIGRHLFHEAVARRAALLAAFLPSMIVWSAIALKDAMVGLIILATTLFCIRLRKSFSVGNILGVVIPIACVYPLRFYLVYFLVLSVVGTIALNRRGGFSKQIVLMGVLAAIIGGVGLSNGARSDLEFFDLSKVSSYRRGMAVSAHSGFDSDADVSTPAKAIAFLPIGIATLLWSPFPWQMTSLRPILTMPEMLIWWWFAAALIRGIIFAVRRHFREVSPILVFSAMLLVGYSLAMGNVGAAFRMRAQILNLLFLFAALGSYLPVVKRKRLPAKMLLADAGAVAYAH